MHPSYSPYPFLPPVPPPQPPVVVSAPLRPAAPAEHYGGAPLAMPTVQGAPLLVPPYQMPLVQQRPKEKKRSKRMPKDSVPLQRQPSQKHSSQHYPSQHYPSHHHPVHQHPVYQHPSHRHEPQQHHPVHHHESQQRRSTSVSQPPPDRLLPILDLPSDIIALGSPPATATGPATTRAPPPLSQKVKQEEAMTEFDTWLARTMPPASLKEMLQSHVHAQGWRLPLSLPDGQKADLDQLTRLLMTRLHASPNRQKDVYDQILGPFQAYIHHLYEKHVKGTATVGGLAIDAVYRAARQKLMTDLKAGTRRRRAVSSLDDQHRLAMQLSSGLQAEVADALNTLDAFLHDAAYQNFVLSRVLLDALCERLLLNYDLLTDGQLCGTAQAIKVRHEPLRYTDLYTRSLGFLHASLTTYDYTPMFELICVTNLFRSISCLPANQVLMADHPTLRKVMVQCLTFSGWEIVLKDIPMLPFIVMKETVDLLVNISGWIDDASLYETRLFTTVLCDLVEQSPTYYGKQGLIGLCRFTLPSRRRPQLALLSPLLISELTVRLLDDLPKGHPCVEALPAIDILRLHAVLSTLHHLVAVDANVACTVATASPNFIPLMLATATCRSLESCSVFFPQKEDTQRASETDVNQFVFEICTQSLTILVTVLAYTHTLTSFDPSVTKWDPFLAILQRHERTLLELAMHAPADHATLASTILSYLS